MASGGQHARVARTHPHQGLSSGVAARYCLVSTTTIGKWIGAGHLAAQRTRGGRYRIRPDDLRTFMVAHGMRTDQLDADFGLEPACWEFFAALDRSAPCGARGPGCEQCPVFRSRAAACHEVRPFLPGGTVRAPSCPDCVFLATVRGVESDEP